jgi:hypothetical protein
MVIKEAIMSHRPICLATSLVISFATITAASGAPLYGSRHFSPEVWAACTKESKNWQKDVAGGTDTFRDHVFLSCAYNGGTMPGGQMPRQWYPD